MKNESSYFATICNLTLLCFLTSASNAAEIESDVCHLFEGEQEFVTQILYMHQEDARHSLVIPKVYFEDFFDRVDGVEVKAQLFRVMLDDFTPVYRQHTATLKKSGNNAFYNFVLHDLVPLEQLLDSELLRSAPGERRRNEAIIDNPRAFFIFEESSFGLESAHPKAEFKMFRDVYVDRAIDGTISAAISCSNSEELLNLRCNHDFRHKEIDIRVNYRREYLHLWKKIQNDVSTFVNCMFST